MKEYPTAVSIYLSPLLSASYVRNCAMSAINCPLYAYPVFDGRISISTDYYYAT